jgi:DNA-binding transcriptional LysR family regulator
LPRHAKLLPDYPDIKVEIITDYGLTDIVTERFDAGVRSGEQSRRQPTPAFSLLVRRYAIAPEASACRLSKVWKGACRVTRARESKVCNVIR